MTKVKVCGVRRLEDGELAVDLGAWAVGFIFHPPSPRHVDPAEAAGIISRLGEDVLTVGVFVDRPVEEVHRIASELDLGAIQLHGGERPEYAAEVRAAGAWKGEIWKSLRVGPQFDEEGVGRYAAFARILLDTYRPEAPGGTGETFDWDVARRVQGQRPILLAGGLKPSNVEEALACVRPEGVDVSSGVEHRPGVKDPAKLRDLFAAVARHDAR
ncbi:MAG: phosphoribosylanthranilate isomerase [Planctomycetota bacterium]|nr:phosphoribosylanthranilate isomerase [Planctomycetota bacterium]